MAELIKPMNYREIAKVQQGKIRMLEYKMEGIKTMITVLLLAFVVTGIGFGLAIKKIKSEPTTVYIQDENRTVDINDLPLAPLEELK
jgi:hypothetical protein